jgi:hypothetical protein
MNVTNSTPLNSKPTIRKPYGNDLNNIAALGNTRFLIPYYQRPYAWGAVEIRQLLDDISSSNLTKQYYIGNIVCSVDSSDGNALKVIDGQQRLTTLFLMLATLGKSMRLTPQDNYNPLLVNESTLRLSYLAREEDNKELLGYFKNELGIFSHSGFETARQVIEEFLRDTKHNLKTIYDYLKDKVSFVLIVLPQDIDYAEYFEVINTHVKQLEKHEVLKSLILSKIDDTDTRAQCAAIWDVCSQMDRWVEYGKSDPDKKTISEAIVPHSKDFAKVCKVFGAAPSENAAITLDKLLTDDANPTSNEADKRALSDEPRIGSIINFPTFLLLVYALESEKDNTIQTSLDDRKLLETMWNEPFKSIKMCAATFIKQLLYWRILFDQYIIKNIRENSDKTRWLIRPLLTTEDSKPDRKIDVDPEFTMLQALLHVSGIPKKDWLLPLMKTLPVVNNCAIRAIADLANIELQIRKNRLLDKDLHDGLKTPHYAFFALDYELWRKYAETDEVWVEGRKYCPKTDFIFRFRNSVEHVYPQNPDTSKPWDDSALNGFGNLTLISQPSNASYSNQLPENKRRDFAKDAEIESMKLLEIYSDDEFTKWLENKGSDHGNQMIQVLIDSFPVDPTFSEVRSALKAQLRSLF